MRTSVVGHIEWVELVRVPQVPLAGAIVHGKRIWEGPGGGGAGAAVQLAKLSNSTSMFTALGDDELGRRAEREISGFGVDLHVGWRQEQTRRAFTHIDDSGERTITVLGERLGPRGSDRLPWDELKASDATYFTAGDSDALLRARESRILVATSRALDVISGSGIRLDALVGSASDPAEIYIAGSLDPSPNLVVMTRGTQGGHYWNSAGREYRFDPPPMSGPIVDRYGAGDSFAGGLTYALAAGASDAEAVGFAARCGGAALGGVGPFEGQLEIGSSGGVRMEER